MYSRKSLQTLLNWKKADTRKPVLMLGARQVGKTTLLRTFAAAHYPQVHEINFEERKDLHRIFERNLDPIRILDEIALSLNRSIDITHDLIIFDEIQACPAALTSLKYFAERMPQLSLCAAGSLLGLFLSGESFPVGKVERVNLYPLSFSEFLNIIGEETLSNRLAEFISQREVPQGLHDRLWDHFKLYMISGGLPEVVKVVLNTSLPNVDRYREVRLKQESIIKDYIADMAKHCGKINAMHLERIFRSAAEQLGAVHEASTQRFKFKGVVAGISQYSRFASAFDWLEKAGLLIKTPLISQIGIPLAAHVKESFFKAFPFDVGILGALAHLPAEHIATYDYGTYKGFFAENFVAQELLAYGHAQLFSWTEGTSEIEFIMQHGGEIIPLEVKSGSRTRSRSLQEYRKKYQPKQSVIISGKPLLIREEDSNGPSMLPLYALEHLKSVL